MSKELKILTVEEFIQNVNDIVKKVEKGEAFGFKSTLSFKSNYKTDPMPVIIKMSSSSGEKEALENILALGFQDVCRETLNGANLSSPDNEKVIEKVISVAAKGFCPAELSVGKSKIYFKLVGDMPPCLL